MESNPTFFRDFAYVFLAAIVGGLLAWRLRQPLIIGYVLAGILISPLTPGPSVSNVHTLELFAEIGVILLMFSIGLEFSIKDLLREKWVALLGGPIGILLLIGMGMGAGHLLGWTVSQGVVVGAIVCVASTMVLTRLLLDQGQLHTHTGRVMVAITLVEDLAVVVLIVVIPGVTKFETARFWAVWQELGRAIVILAPALFVAAKIVPPLLKRVARTQNRELFFIVVLAICLGSAALTQAAGLSLALGAFVAGLIISESDYAHEALAQLFPLRDAFVALFFVTIGLLIDPRTLFSNLPIVGTMFALIVFGKLAVWTGVVRLFGYPIWMALTVGVGLTQIGELSFVLVQGARNAGIVGNDIYNATLAASLVTILLNAALFRSIPPWLARMSLARQVAAHSHVKPEGEGLRNHVVLCGFGRVGSAIGTALETFGVQYVVVEIDPDICGELRRRGIPSIFGDSAHPHILHQAGTEEASMVILTIPDPDRARLAILNARRMNPNVPIIARTHRRIDHEVMAHAGATEIIQPELEASATMIRHAFPYIKLPDDQVRAYLRGFREAMESLQGKPSTTLQTFPEARELTLSNPSFGGRSIRDSRIRERFGVTVISIRRASGEALLDPPAGTILELGDRLRVLGLSDEIDAFTSQAAASGW
ncbi:MAG: cation:proton antiporter [Acidobacteria bacterium]|nr:cation:proton antiporter [Acidobacteriota bacterium]